MARSMVDQHAFAARWTACQGRSHAKALCGIRRLAHREQVRAGHDLSVNPPIIYSNDEPTDWSIAPHANDSESDVAGGHHPRRNWSHPDNL
jgi:hypothetical protein